MNATRTNSRMNASRTHRRTATANRYPNAAGKAYYLDMLTDAALGSASFIGVLAILFFLATSF